MKIFLSVLFVFFALSSSLYSTAIQDPLKGVALKDHLTGPQLEKGALKGKVVLVEYWKYSCPGCRSGLSSLTFAYNRYEITGKFAVVLSYVTEFKDNAKEYLTEKAPTIPCYLDMNIPEAPRGKSTPYAVLFDHTGKIIAKGSHTELMEMVDKLVEDAPVPPLPILGELEVKYCKSQAKQLLGGKNLMIICRSLQNLAKKNDDKGKEAQDMLKAAFIYINKEKLRLEESMKIFPASTLAKLDKFYTQIRGLKCDKEIKTMILELKRDKYVNFLNKTMSKVLQTKEKVKKKGKSTKSDERVFIKAKADLYKMIETGKPSDSVINEARCFMDTF